jgi:hypothetical protein
MAYIGNTAASKFVSNRAASVYSGDGSTVAFTLEQVVAQDEDVLVSVDGVVQEPSVAYAVSSGTTLTFTAAPSNNAGNNIFVYYLASQAGTIGHPSSQALSATSGTFTGNIVIPNGGNIGSVGDTDAISIASNGVVTFSQTPVGDNAGAIVQVKNVQTGAVATGTTSIPNDDTIPQNTEGDEFMTLAITPTNSSNKLRIEVNAFGASGTANRFTTMALFQDSTASAISATSTFGDQETATFPLVISHYMTAGTTSETTFKIRIGLSTANTFTFNGWNGGRIFGGVANSSITITEIAV